MQRFLAAICICLAFPGMAAERAVDLELVLATDISGSMDRDEANLQRQGFVDALRHSEVIRAIQGGMLGRIAVTYIEWAGEHHQRTLVGWTELSDTASAAAFADAVSRPEVTTERYTSISTVIAAASRSFAGNGFEGTRRVIDISGDGPNNKGAYVLLARDRALADGVVINGLPIINDRPSPRGYPSMAQLDLYYEDCVIGGPGAFIVVAKGFEDFARAILRKMVLEIAGLSPPPERLHFVANRPRPACDAGERQLEKWRPPGFYDF